jgi:hypothetical protein
MNPAARPTPTFRLLALQLALALASSALSVLPAHPVADARFEAAQGARS